MKCKYLYLSIPLLYLPAVALGQDLVAQHCLGQLSSSCILLKKAAVEMP